eukprot:g32195.t1
MDDEEGEEDEEELPLPAKAQKEVSIRRSMAQLTAQDELFHTGEECIDRVAEAAGMDVIGQGLLLLNHVDHPHPRVRFTALHGLGQLANDQSPHFQEGCGLRCVDACRLCSRL